MKPKKIFIGWWIVWFTGIVTGIGSGFYIYGLSVFFKDLAADLGLNRAITSTAAGITRLEGSFGAFFTGWLVDKYGPKWVMFIGICVFSLALALMSMVNSVWAYILVWGVMLGLGNDLGLTIAADKTLTSWFIGKRGLAQGIRFSLIGLFGVIVVPVVAWMVLSFGWRLTCLLWAGIMLLSLPLVLLLIKKELPEHYGLLPDGAKLPERTASGAKDTMLDKGVAYASSFEETEFSFKEAVKTSGYWLPTLAYGLHSIVTGGFTVHCIPFLTDMGIDAHTAANMMSLMLLFTIPSRFFGSLISDRISKKNLKYIMAAMIGLTAAGIIAFLISHSLPVVYVMLILFGLGSGAVTPAVVLMTGRYFGRKAFGFIFSSTIIIRAPMAFAAPIFSGWIYDSTGSYINAFIVFAVIGLAGAALACFTRVPTKKTR